MSRLPHYRRKSLWRSLVMFAWVASTAICISTASQAADPAFVGIISLAVDPTVAEKLELSEEVQEKLAKLVAEREDDVASLALELRKLPPTERREKLKPFVEESEKLGLALLTAEQQQELERIHLARLGVAALLRPNVASAIKLTDDQTEKLSSLADEMEEKLVGAPEAERIVTRATYQRQMVAVLDNTQRAAWEKMTAPGATEVAAVDAPESTPMPDDETEPAPMKPAETTPAETPETPAEEASPTKPPLPPMPAAPATTTTSPPVRTANTVPSPAAPATGTPAEVRLKFNFTYAPWKDVLEWFAKQADLSLVMESPPPGTFNYSDQRSYNPSEAIDLLNGVLLTKGYTLLRRERMLMMINLEDGIPPALVPQVTPEELEALGKYEVVSCLFTISKMAPEDAETELRKMLGPQGSLSVLPKAKQVYVTETAGKLRLIRRAIDAVENPAINEKDEHVTSIVLEHTTPGEFLVLARPLLGIPENINASPDGSLRMAVDDFGGRLLVTGKPERVEKVQELVKIIDVDAGFSEEGGGPIESPQLEVYSISSADPNSTLQVMQTLLAGLPDVRLAIDSKTGNLIALARPSQHLTIKATLDQLQRDSKQVEVIRLRTVDPQVAVLAINKLFGGSGEEGSSTGPTVDADPTSMQLLIRGTTAQIEQIRDLMTKMGEVDYTDDEVLAERKNFRVLNLTGRAADSALGQLELIWPTIRENKIRVRTPANSSAPDIQQRRTPGHEAPPEFPPSALPPETRYQPGSPRPAPAANVPVDRDVRWQRGPRAIFVSQLGTTPAAESAEPATTASQEAEKPADTEAEPTTGNKSIPGAEIIVTQGPGGLIIASDDLDALDEFEKMLLTIADTTAATGREYTIFYLKFAKADGAADLLREALGVQAADDGGGGGGGGGGLFGDLAQGVLGDSGGLLGGLLGIGGGAGGGSSADTGTVTIIPDLRLNALLVHAGARDLDTMEQLLKVIDQPSSPEDVQTVARPRIIPVLNTSAVTVADVLKQVYSSRLQADAGQQRQQPSPEEFLRALRGGRGGQQTQKKSEEQKVTIGVDERTNSLIVSAPEYLFAEIQDLVAKLDTAEIPSDETVQVVTLKRTNPEVIQRTLAAVLGDKVEVAAGNTGSSSSRGSSTRSSSNNQPAPPSNPQDDLRNRLEFFQQIQRMQQQGGGGGRGSSSGGGGFGGGRGGGSGSFGGGRGGR